tara:strand:+ start:437 stop:2041 length:1605 start_codon:yes stop_codon:yes gene_type:complete
MRIFLLLGILYTPPALAAQCLETDINKSLQYLRRLSLDLRGHPPSTAEYKEVIESGEVSGTVLQGMLESEGFLAQLRDHHQELLWTNVTSQRLTVNTFVINEPRRNVEAAYYVRAFGRASRYRGATIGCLDEPVQYDENGQIMTTCDDNGVCREGWRWVTPYWDPSSRIKVCAFDAQENLTGVNRDNPNRQVECISSTNSMECGCGPNLQFCEFRSANTHRAITNSFAEQLLRFMDKVVAEDRPYTDVLLGMDVEVNGPIAHFHRYQSRHGGNFLRSSTDPGYPIPEELHFTDTNRWISVQRTGLHSGVLTLFGYLLKFQSNRGRANRFNNAFLCHNFQAPKGGLPASDDACHTEPNLTKRCGCKYCHVGVEPDAAYWGRWSEAGTINLDEDTYPMMREDCLNGSRSGICRNYYFIDPRHEDEMPYKGYLLAYVFADALGTQEEGSADGDYSNNITEGPRGLAQRSIDNGTFAQCTVSKLWTRLLAREPTASEAEELIRLTEAFIASNYNMRSLAREIVSSDAYRGGSGYGEKR